LQTESFRNAGKRLREAEIPLRFKNLKILPNLKNLVTSAKTLFSLSHDHKQGVTQEDKGKIAYLLVIFQNQGNSNNLPANPFLLNSKTNPQTTISQLS
jgi:hypothetical protein